MESMNYIFYKDYLKTKKINEASIFISKTKKSYLIGPKINEKFDEISFYKRLISSSVYTTKIYKNMRSKNAKKIINNYYNKLNNNEVIEIFKDGNINIHYIIPLPGEEYEEK